MADDFQLAAKVAIFQTFQTDGWAVLKARMLESVDRIERHVLEDWKTIGEREYRDSMLERDTMRALARMDEVAARMAPEDIARIERLMGHGIVGVRGPEESPNE